MSEQVLLLPYFHKGVIYLIENIQDRMKYIGKTTSKNPEKYIKNHFNSAKRKDDLKRNSKGKYLYNAIRKYGVQNFKWRILGEIYSLSEKELKENLDEAEIDCIYHFRTFGADGENEDSIYGYNRTKGGDGGNTYLSFSKERKKQAYDKMAVTQKENRIGKVITKEEHSNRSKGCIQQWKNPNRKLKSSKSLKKFHKENPNFLSGKNNPRYIEIDLVKLTQLVNCGNTLNELSLYFNVTRGVIKSRCKALELKVKIANPKCICNICGKQYSRMGMNSHVWRVHTKQGELFSLKNKNEINN